MGKGSNTTTTSTSPNAGAMAAYQQLMQRASGVASTPYQPYSGQLTAPINAQQNLGVGNINAYSNWAMPYITQGAGYANAAAQPLSQADISRYQSPYTQSVVDSTTKWLNQQNAQQQQGVLGDAASSGALGGDRVGVAQANLAAQQTASQAPIIAGLYNQGYGQALQTAQQQQQNQANAAYSLGNLGVAGQGAGLQGAGAQFGVGAAEQQTEQARLNALYQQFQIAQAFPYQQSQWLAGIDTGVGSQMGGTSTTTAPPPNPLNTILGAGVAGAGVAGNLGWKPFGVAARGGRISGKIAGFADGGAPLAGTPYGGVAGYIPGINITPGRGAPQSSQAPGAGVGNPGMDLAKMGMQFSRGTGSGVAGPGSAVTDYGSETAGFAPEGGIDMTGMGLFDTGAGVADAGAAAAEAGAGFSIADILPFLALAKRGGRISGVAGFADGGSPSFDDRWAPVDDAISSGQFDPAGMNFPARDAPGPVDVPGRAFAGDYDLPPEITGTRGGVAMPASALAFDGGTSSPGVGVASLDDLAYGSPRAAPPPAPPLSLAAPPAKQRPAWGDAMIAAGLGMMASKSPHPGVAIGEGGMAGLSTYLGQEQQKVANTQKQQSLDLQIKHLDQQAEQARQHIANETAKIAEGKRQHDQTFGMAQRKQDFEENKPITMPIGSSLVSRKGDVIRENQSPTLSGNAIEVGARQMVGGDMSPLVNVGRGAQGDAKINAYRNRMAEILVDEYGMTPTDAGAYASNKVQEFKARGIGMTAEARTAGTREANLNIILKATEAAVPAALEASEKLGRTGFVPLNQILQKGQVMTSNPELREFGMANLQLAEHWARAMNPTGVMRESDRDKALEFLSTADSPETYKRVVTQLQKQIKRERDAVASQRPVVPGGAAPSEIGGAGTGGAGDKPNTVTQNGHIYTLQPDGSYK